jgi:AcrR family transcriptional regulator
MSVADLMKLAGLTHGGFYARFESREALVVEAFALAVDQNCLPMAEDYEGNAGRGTIRRYR